MTHTVTPCPHLLEYHATQTLKLNLSVMLCSPLGSFVQHTRLLSALALMGCLHWTMIGGAPPS